MCTVFLWLLRLFSFQHSIQDVKIFYFASLYWDGLRQEIKCLIVSVKKNDLQMAETWLFFFSIFIHEGPFCSLSSRFWAIPMSFLIINLLLWYFFKICTQVLGFSIHFGFLHVKVLMRHLCNIWSATNNIITCNWLWSELNWIEWRPIWNFSTNSTKFIEILQNLEWSIQNGLNELWVVFNKEIDETLT